MNIARIQRMAVQGDLSVDGLRYLLRCRTECEHLDFKSDIDLNNDHSACDIAKDIVGMKNIGGGYIVIGVADKTWIPIGLSRSTKFDTKMLRDLVRKYTGLDIDNSIVEHLLNIEEDIRRFTVICVRASAKFNKLKNPSICKVSFQQSENWGIRKGDIYIRDGDQTVRLDDLDKLNEKLDDLQDKYQEAEQEEATSTPSPFEVETGLYRLLPKEYGNFVGRETLLKDIKSAIDKDPRIWIINIYGPGGVGKSALATRVAYDYYESRKFEAILHLSAKDRELIAGGGIHPLRPSLISIEDFIDRVLHLFSHQECCNDDLRRKKELVNELLCAFSTLIILDNMETVNDGRIMEFVREFPPESKAKVLLTSRQRNREWEMPIRVPELSDVEIKEFIAHRSKELKLDFPYTDDRIISTISKISGGLPLAIQWILGDYSRTKDLPSILNRVLTNESPLLEFSFRNSWKTLDSESQHALAILPIFDEPPTLLEWRTVLNWTIDKIERAKGNLIESTFVTERTDQKTGNKVFLALPITLSFARIELDKLGNLGIEAQSRYETYKHQIALAQEQEFQSENLFEIFDARTDTQRKSILFARMAEGQMSSLGYQEAEEYYKKALEMDPFSIYALVSYSKFKAGLFEYHSAIELLNRAISKMTKKIGFIVYFNLADVYGRMKDWGLKAKYLREALKYGESTTPYLYTMAQHSLGVALGKMNNHSEAIRNFDEIIDRELAKPYGPTQSLVIAARTKKISLKRTHPNLCKPFLDDLIASCKGVGTAGYILEDLIHIRDEE